MTTTTTRRGFCGSTSAAFAIGITGLAGCGSPGPGSDGDATSSSDVAGSTSNSGTSGATALASSTGDTTAEGSTEATG